MENADLTCIRLQVRNELAAWLVLQELEARDNGTLMLMYYNACVDGNLAMKMAIERVMNGRKWYVEQATPRANPTWTKLSE
jgi:hypothetical protein